MRPHDFIKISLLIFYNAVHKFDVSTSIHMFAKTIWDKLGEGGLSPKSHEPCDYWLSTAKQQTLCIKTYIF